MTLDPRTPVLVGGGQVSEHDGGIEPVDLIAEAARAAAAEAGSPRLLETLDTVWLSRILSWPYRDPGLLVAHRIGAVPRHTGYSGTAGSVPQVLLARAADDIAAGRRDAVLVGGAESWRTLMKLRAQDRTPEWTVQPEAIAPAENLVPDVPMGAEAEKRIGFTRPAHIYPLFDDALRLRLGRTRSVHRDALGRLWSRMSRVAAENPHAWSREALSTQQITTPSRENRMIASPYTKRMNSNNMVDQAAALLMCSAATADALGIGRDRWVFPHASVEGHDTYAVAERPALDRCHAIRIGGQRALELSGVGLDDIAYVDLYSCFPSAVQIAARELGLPLDDPARPLTVTGGLSFAGGPWCNYSAHAVASIAGRLRDNPGNYGLVTANSGYLTKQAVGVYSTEPPASGFRRADVQAEIDRVPTVRALDTYAGPATTEASTVVYDRSGEPERAFLAARTPAGERVLAVSRDDADIDALQSCEDGAMAVDVAADGTFHVSGSAAGEGFITTV
ncbi:acetyl-CoA acetyltransferase [Tomitella cavernea]|nr:acetyl-CoA acetyltransferase [Tomitella cavernea]